MKVTRQDFMHYISNLNADADIPLWSGYMPEKVLHSGQKFFDLPTAVRALMIADGTVTMALEAIYQEPIQVSLKEQTMLDLDHSVPLLELASGKQAFFRQVELRGEDSKRCYVSAFSILKEGALSSTLWERLRNREVGMGVVLRNASQGSFRRVLHIDTGNLVDRHDPSHVHRTYSVTIDDNPAILITEIFSLEALRITDR